jgi:hypothetical protein
MAYTSSTSNMVSTPCTNNTASTLSTSQSSPVPNCDYTNSVIVSSSALGVSTREKQDMAALALKGKTLAVSGQLPTTSFFLPSANQRNSPFVRIPGELRNGIYELGRFKDSRIHLYELPSGVKGFNCEDDDLSQPCLGSAPCHVLVGQINPFFPDRNKDITRCPESCDCAPINLLALAGTCQFFHNEIFSFVYRSNIFVASKCVFASFLNNDNLLKQQTLSAALSRIRNLQVDLGHGKYGSMSMVQSKHATLRVIKEHATELRELCVTFTTCLQGLNQNPIDDESIRLLSRFRGLKGFKLAIKNARETYRGSMYSQNENEAAFLRAVPYMEDIFEKFVRLRDMDDMTGLDKLEVAMVKKETRFISGLKQKVKAMLAEEE